MSWRVTTASILALLAAVVSGAVALYAWRHRDRRMALQFIALEVTLAAWSLAYAVQLGFGTFPEQASFQRITLAVAGFVPTVWLLFAFAYTGRRAWLSRNRVALFLSEPVLWTALCLTNPVHGLVWADAALTETVLGPVIALAFGPGYAVHIAYAYAIVALGIGLILVHTSRVAPAYRKQATALLVAVLPPFLSHIAFTLHLSPVPALDLTPFLFALTGLSFGLALFEFDLLRLSPIARQQAFREVGDGLVIVNADGDIVDVIGVASEVFDTIPRIGDPVETIVSGPLSELDASEVTVTRNGTRRVYQYQVSPLSVHHDQRVGTLIIVRDITGLHESKQRLSVTNRVLRHNLRNDMNVVQGFSRRLEDTLEGEAAADARRIREAVDRFVELTNKVERMAQLKDHTGGALGTVDLSAELTDLVADHETEHPEATFTLEVPPGAVVEDVDPDRLRLAIDNLLDNAVEHNTAAHPTVAVTVEEGPDAVRIEVSDNGPGIPETEREAIGASMETQLSHSQGLGLWLTHWCTEEWGGSLTFETDDAEGTTVRLTVPRRGAAAD